MGILRFLQGSAVSSLDVGHRRGTEDLEVASVPGSEPPVARSPVLGICVLLAGDLECLPFSFVRAEPVCSCRVHLEAPHQVLRL